MLIGYFCFQIYGGMRGMKGLIYETSVLDPDEVRRAQTYSNSSLHGLPIEI